MAIGLLYKESMHPKVKAYRRARLKDLGRSLVMSEVGMNLVAGLGA